MKNSDRLQVEGHLQKYNHFQIVNTLEKQDRTRTEIEEPTLKRNDLNFIQQKITSSCTEMDTEIKACLYFVLCPLD